MNKKGEQYCTGCGIKLQSISPDEIGYIPQKVMEKAVFLYCKRCHDLKHHNTVLQVNDETIDSDEIINLAANSMGLLVFVIDIFNFKNSIRKIIINKLHHKKLILVINKFDCLPQSIKSEKIKGWIKRQFPKNINILQVIITSAKKNLNIEELSECIERHRNGRDVYFLGETNVGKSSLINSYLKIYKNNTAKLVTTSLYPNTTLQIIEIPLDHNSYLFDTPGLCDNSSFYFFIEPKLVKSILPKKEIKPRVFQIRDPQRFFLGNLVKIEIIPTSRSSLTMYFADSISIHRSKITSSDDKFHNLIQNKQLSPISKKIKSTDDFVKHQFIVPNTEKIDIMIYGLGFITIRNHCNQIITVYLPTGILAEMIETLI